MPALRDILKIVGKTVLALCRAETRLNKAVVRQLCTGILAQYGLIKVCRLQRLYVGVLFPQQDKSKLDNELDAVWEEAEEDYSSCCGLKRKAVSFRKSMKPFRLRRS